LNENIRNISSVILLAFLCICAPRPASALDLLSAYRMAAATSPMLKEARALLEADIAARRSAKSALLPHIGAGAEINYQDADISGFGEDFASPAIPPNAFGDINEQYYGGNYSVKLVQPLIAGESWSALKAADSRVAAGRAAVVAAEQDLIVQVADAYFGVLNARAEAGVARSQKQLLKEILDQAQANLNVGTGDIISLKEAQARFDAAESSLIGAWNGLEVARQQLRSLTHQPVGKLLDIETLEPEGPLPDAVDPWLATARDYRPALAQAREQMNAAARQVEAAERVRWPDMNLNAAYGFNKGDLFPSVENRKGLVGLTVSVPLYTGGQIEANVGQAKAQAEAVRYRLDGLSDQVNLGVETAFANLRTSVAQLRALARALESSETSFAATRRGYEVGARTTIDVLAAAQDLENVRRTYYEAKYRHIQARVRLKWAAGILAVEDVAAINGLLVEKFE